MKKTWVKILLVVCCVLIIAALGALTVYYSDLPSHLSQHETIILGQSQMVPGSQAGLRILVRDTKDGSPLDGAAVTVSFKGEDGKKTTVFEGVSDQNGTTDVQFTVPKELSGSPTLVVETKSELGEDAVENTVTLNRDYRLYLTTDKPIYQPGQIIHMRALALGTFDLQPAVGQTVDVTIADGKGNKVFRESFVTSEYGVASSDFQLADEVNTGDYKIIMVMGGVSSEKTVRVENYVLPKFDVSLTTDRTFYMPGQTVQGEINAAYFFGKPVSEAVISLEGFTYDFERVVTFTLEGTSDENGRFTFEFTLPDYIAGSDLEGGTGRYYLQATVIDQANHTETESTSLPVSANNLIIDAVPESGQFRPGVDNILYVLTSLPDGSPVAASLRVTFHETGEISQIETSEYGLAEVHVTPVNPYQSITVEAEDAAGNVASRYYDFGGEWNEEYVLLRPDKPVYKVGEMMQLSLLTSQSQGVVYLDIVREGQTVSTRSVTIEDGKAELGIDLGEDLYGTLEIHAYKILTSGTITRDTRMVVVDNADDLNLSVNMNQESYLPGEQAQVGIQVSGQDKEGVQSALGIAIVDESVFALAEQDPGFARLYFLLEEEILEPKYDLHGYTLENLVSGIPETDAKLTEAVETAAEASLAEVALEKVNTGSSNAFTLQVNSYQENMGIAYQTQQEFFEKFTKGLAFPFYILPIGLMVLSILSLAKEKQIWKSLGVAIGIGLLLIAFSFLLGYFIFNENAEWLLIVILIALVAAILALIIYTFISKPPMLGWILGLYVLYIALAIFLVYSLNESYLDVSNGWIILGVVTTLLAPLALLLRSAGYLLQKRSIPGWLLILGGVVPALFVGIVISSSSYLLSPKAAMGVMNDGVIMKEVMGVEQGVVEQEMMVEDMVMVEAPAAEADGGTTQAVEAPRLRQYFPETMLWLPEAVTDEDGTLDLDISLADSITTWRMTALASSKDGRLGSTTVPLRVFQDFFIDLDLPVSLTAGDEVSIPVGVYNYLEEEQSVRLEIEQADWFELMDPVEQEITIPANDVSVVYYRVKAVEFGKKTIKVTAWGSSMSDAIQKEVQVYPNGKQIRFSQSDRLTPGEEVQYDASIPEDAVAGTQSLVVKIYPGIMSQVVEGLDSILRMPYGCFEQTSSTTYPNVLVMDYLQTTNQAAPEVQMKAEEYINLGYQRLTTFEVASSGGFSLFGDAPADRMLTAYGLQEFTDMSRVQSVDPDLISRAAQWLLSQQTSDGSWENDQGLVHENTWASLADDRLPVTAYIVWSLTEAGYAEDAGVQRGLAYIQEFQSKAEDPYVVALVANALVAADLKKGGEISSVTQTVLDRLASLAKQDGGKVFWDSGIATFMGSEGNTGSIETTALATLAFLKADVYPDLANGALTHLIQQKDSFGTWYSTQATVLTLKALIQSVRSGAENINANVTITLNGSQSRTVEVSKENFDVVQLVSFDDVNIGGANSVEITAEGEGNLMYQVTGSYYLPWEKLADYPELIETEEPVTINVEYDRTELEINDTVEVTVTITLNEVGGFAEAGLIDLGLPPGFSVETEDLNALVARFQDVPEDYAFPTIERYELTGRQILIYVCNLSADTPLEFSYRLRAKYPLEVQAPSSNAYDYYNPDVSGEQAPQILVVQDED